MIKRKFFLAASLILSLMFPYSASLGRIIYVDDDASGLNDGSSWENAYIFLQDALADANNGNKQVEIKVAQGVYTPDKGQYQQEGDYTASFELINGVTLSGGYAGNSEYDPNTRDINLYETILSGDLLNNDAEQIDPNNFVNEPTCFDNSFHVLIYGGSTLVTRDSNDSSDETQVTSHDSAVLDGFIIKSGNAGGIYLDLDSKSLGGGMYIRNSNSEPLTTSRESQVTISNCTFISNAAYKGGAIYIDKADSNIIDCRFIGNCADIYLYITSELAGNGGAIFNNGGSAVLTSCDFIDNFSKWGSGIYNFSDNNSVLTDCKFIRNLALFQGGGLFNYMSEPILKNCTFSENYSMDCGGGIANSTFSNPELDNCTFQENQAVNSGGAIYNIEYSEPNMTKSGFTKNQAAYGGAIANEDSNMKLEECTFNRNKAFYGGCFDNTNGNPIFSNCTFRNNITENEAGVIQNFFGQPDFVNCIFSGNLALKSAGAVFNVAGDIKFNNCTFFGNYAKSSGSAVQNTSVQFGSNSYMYSSADFLNCIIWNGQKAILNQDGSSISINYCDVESGLLAIDGSSDKLTWGQGNISADPCFVESGRWIDVNDPNKIIEPNDVNAIWLEGDYHLKSTAGHYDPNSKTWVRDDLNSPCIDAGDQNSPVAGEPLPNGNRINMGAYGGTSQASMSPGESLVAYWRLDEMDGETAQDSAGFNDVNVFQPQWVEGKLDGALLFDGVGTYMDCGSSGTFSTAQMTVSFWIEPADNDEISYILNRGSSNLSSTDYCLILNPDGKIELGIGQDNAESVYVLSNAAALPEQWTHIAVTLNGSAACIYINGQLDNSVYFPQRTASGDYNLTIGSLAGLTCFYHGRLDDIRIYNLSLNQQEIELLIH